MKFLITFKTPDVIEYAADNYPEENREEIREAAKKFVTYGEYITVLFDSQKKTATVLPSR